MGDDDQQRKRRKLATLATALVAKYVSNESNESSSTGRDCPQFKGRKTGSPTVRRFRSNDSHMFLSDMSDRLFRRRYRMKKASFFQQLEQLRLHLPPDETSSTGNKRNDLDGFFLLLLIGVSVAPSTAFEPNSAKVIAIKSFCS